MGKVIDSLFWLTVFDASIAEAAAPSITISNQPNNDAIFTALIGGNTNYSLISTRPIFSITVNGTGQLGNSVQKTVTLTVTYTPTQGNQSTVLQYRITTSQAWATPPASAQHTGPITNATPQVWRIEFQRNTNVQPNTGAPTIGGFRVIVELTLRDTLTGSVQKYSSNPVGGSVRFASQQQAQTQQQAQSQNQNQTGSQQSTQQQWAILLQQQQLGRISGRGTTMILKRRFNPKSGKVELIKNGVISRLGYLNLKGKNLNRRQALRNYRYR